MKTFNFLSALVLSIAVIASAIVLGNAYKYKYKTDETIVVTGLGKKDFKADLVIWNADFQTKNFDLKLASEQLNNDKKIIEQYLISQGIKSEEIIFNAVSINKEFDYRYDENGRSQSFFTGYVLNQSIEIQSKDLDKIDNVSRKISDLISQGIELSSSMPNYYYSGLEDLKLELIANATENARKRAENIAEKSNAKLGNLKKASMGVFQITGQYSNEDFTYGGVYNTSSRDKTANITVKLEFNIN